MMKWPYSTNTFSTSSRGTPVVFTSVSSRRLMSTSGRYGGMPCAIFDLPKIFSRCAMGWVFTSSPST